MEPVLLIEVQVPSRRILMEDALSEEDWLQIRAEELLNVDEKRLQALCHIKSYQERIAKGFSKKVRPREFQPGDLVLKAIIGDCPDTRGKFKPNWEGPYVIKEVLPGYAVRLVDLDRNELPKPTNVDRIKKYYA
uniref:Uncharacterized protein n=1 Tax=Nelumbo nucifera TaxID=4432 RepID=A0A822Y156_NELNU|nr:TPA_asm: hypothetical protein HUJ06_024841 [Nelumbo nucifera]